MDRPKTTGGTLSHSFHCGIDLHSFSQAFEWKAKQNVDLIMDRRSLHKSRMESEALRRQETSSYLAMKLSKSNSQNIAESEPYDEETKSVKPFFSSHLLIPIFHSRFAPRMRRPLSGRKHFANIIIDAEKNEEIQKTKDVVDIQPKTSLNVIKDGVMVSSSLHSCLSFTPCHRVKRQWQQYKEKLLRNQRKKL